VQDFQTQVIRLRTERLNDYQRQQEDLRTNANRELRDAQIAKQRALKQAQDALNRELEMARRGQNAMLDMTAQFWQNMVALVPAGGGGNNSNQDMRNVVLDVLKQVRTR
jgi:phosphomevalonate kinase